MAVLTLNYLPVGYRFSPTDEELVNFYLKLKIEGHDKKVEAIPEVDVCKWEPWDLPNLSVIKNEDPEWFFFCPRDQKYPKGRRSNRATEKGYWKATGKDRTIKARSAGMKLIGMKKTLVFHIGRAPGGQRTAWIMHEYRMTSEEGPFVLCRLFNKEKAESNCDETEPTGFSPTATSSSPESMRVEKTMVQATPESDMQAGENPTGIKRWLEDKSDNNTSTTSLPEQSYSNSCHASDVDDHETELRGVQVDAQQGEYKGILDDPTHETLDQALLAPLHVETSTGLGPFNVNSTFANEFCNTHNEMVDQDWSPADLEFLEKVFNNQGDGDDASSLKHSSVRSEPDVASFCVHQSGDSIFGKESGSTTDTDNEVLQVQAYSELEAFGGAVNTNESLQLQKALELNDGFYGEEFWNGNLDILMCDPPPALDSSSVESPTYYQTTGSLHRATPVDDAKNTIGTGVKIRSRHPQYNSSSQNLVYQGTAPRRLRLQRKLTRRVTSFKGRESSCNVNDQDVKPRVSEATGENAIPASEDGSEISRELEKRPRLRLRPNSIKAQSRREVIKSDQQDSSLIAKAPLIRPFTYSLRYMVSAALIMIIMAVLFVSAWRCLAT